MQNDNCPVLEGSGVLNDVIRCRRCALCAVGRTAGFMSEEYYVCTDRSTVDDTFEVEPGDGCTFGVPGEPMNGARFPSVVLERPVVDGYSIETEETWKTRRRRR